MEKLKYVFESEKDIEALRLESKNSKFAIRAILWIYGIMCVFAGICVFFEPITEWIESKVKKSKSDDLDD
jgi:uncharacterized membrane protein